MDSPLFSRRRGIIVEGRLAGRPVHSTPGQSASNQATVVSLLLFLLIAVLLLSSGTVPLDKAMALLGRRATPELCRNTRQGREIVADQNGYVCNRGELRSGCCAEDFSPERFSCRSCNTTFHCCEEYERCVSCCMDPAKRELVMSTLLESRNPVFHTAKDSFDFCRARCRTSSSSVVNHKRYRSHTAKYCYGPSAPPIASEEYAMEEADDGAAEAMLSGEFGGVVDRPAQDMLRVAKASVAEKLREMADANAGAGGDGGGGGRGDAERCGDAARESEEQDDGAPPRERRKGGDGASAGQRLGSLVDRSVRMAARLGAGLRGEAAGEAEVSGGGRGEPSNSASHSTVEDGDVHMERGAGEEAEETDDSAHGSRGQPWKAETEDAGRGMPRLGARAGRAMPRDAFDAEPALSVMDVDFGHGPSAAAFAHRHSDEYVRVSGSPALGRSGGASSFALLVALLCIALSMCMPSL